MKPVVRYLDLAVLVLALPVFVLAGFPLLGYATGAAAWLVQRAIQVVLIGRAAASNDPRTVVGIMAGSMIARGWIAALIIIGVALGTGHNDVGLSASVLVILLFTIYFPLWMISQPFPTSKRETVTS